MAYSPRAPQTRQGSARESQSELRSSVSLPSIGRIFYLGDTSGLPSALAVLIFFNSRTVLTQIEAVHLASIYRRFDVVRAVTADQRHQQSADKRTHLKRKVLVAAFLCTAKPSGASMNSASCSVLFRIAATSTPAHAGVPMLNSPHIHSIRSKCLR